MRRREGWADGEAPLPLEAATSHGAPALDAPCYGRGNCTVSRPPMMAATAERMRTSRWMRGGASQSGPCPETPHGAPSQTTCYGREIHHRVARIRHCLYRTGREKGKNGAWQGLPHRSRSLRLMQCYGREIHRVARAAPSPSQSCAVSQNEAAPTGGTPSVSKHGTPAWKLASNHWPDVFPVFGDAALLIFLCGGSSLRQEWAVNASLPHPGFQDDKPVAQQGFDARKGVRERFWTHIRAKANVARTDLNQGGR